MLKNPLAEQSEFVRNRIYAKNQEQKDYWSQKIMEDALKDLSFDYFFSQRNFSFDKIDARLKLISKGNKNIHEVDVYRGLIQKAGITFVPDFSFSGFYYDKEAINKNIAFFPESGKQEKNLSYNLTNDIQEHSENSSVLIRLADYR